MLFKTDISSKTDILSKTDMLSETDMLSKAGKLHSPLPPSAPAVYIHIPFCVSKCAYCDFYSLPCAEKSPVKQSEETYGERKNGASTQALCKSEKYSDGCFAPEIYELHSRYVDALCRQMRAASERYDRPRVSTVFIGGGTPSVLKTEEIRRIFDTLFSCFDIPTDAEITLEANPDTLSYEKLCAYRKMGINRLSIGMQSAVDSELKAISRIHTARSVAEAVKNARAAGFENINLDIMYALPFQTEESFKTTLDTVLSLSPEHVSVYGLQLEEGTPLFKNREKLTFPGEDGENLMNALAQSVLEKNGYRRYEISNYAREGFECRHNLNYWTLGEYFGFGVAAHSFKDGKRESIKKDIHAYCALSDFSEVTEVEEILTEEEYVDEYVMVSLRLCKGLSLSALNSLSKNADTYVKRAEPFVKCGLMEIYELDGERFLRFTPNGFNVSNTVLSEILYL